MLASTSADEAADKPKAAAAQGRGRSLKLAGLETPFSPAARNAVPARPETGMRLPGHLAKAGSRVPDVMGKTVRNAVELFARAGVVPELKGSGSRVVKQSPLPGTAWPEDDRGGIYPWLSER